MGLLFKENAFCLLSILNEYHQLRIIKEYRVFSPGLERVFSLGLDRAFSLGQTSWFEVQFVDVCLALTSPDDGQ